MATTAPARPTGLVSINSAAEFLGVKPWEMVRLVEDMTVASVYLVDAASLSRYAEERQG